MRKLMLVVVLFLMSGSVQANNTLPEAVIGVSPARDWFYNLEDVFFDSGDSSDPNGYISYTKWYINGVLHTSGSYWRNMSECFALYGSPSNGCYELGVGETTVEIELRVQDNSGNWDIETKVITIREYKGRKYFIKDHLGSVRTTVTREDGKVLGYDDYYPFGLAIPGRSSNSANPNDNYKFTGHERDDEAGLTLDYMMARNYDPMIGRFLQVDPMLEYASPYVYVGNNPLNLTDPTGMLSTLVEENDDGTYRVIEGGNPNDGDDGIYVGSTNGKKIGNSVTSHSFYDENENAVEGAIIDLNSTDGQDFLDDEIIADDPSVLHYKKNATNNEHYDFKVRGIDKKGAQTDLQYKYRGSVAKGGKIGSARDFGNMAAGFVAGRANLPWTKVKQAFEKLQGGAEPKVSAKAQRKGFLMGQKQYINDLWNGDRGDY